MNFDKNQKLLITIASISTIWAIGATILYFHQRNDCLISGSGLRGGFEDLARSMNDEMKEYQKKEVSKPQKLTDIEDKN